jgi:hypothetical protein
MYRSLIAGILEIFITLSQQKKPEWIRNLDPQDQQQAIIGFLDETIMELITKITDQRITKQEETLKTYKQLRTWLPHTRVLRHA